MDWAVVRLAMRMQRVRNLVGKGLHGAELVLPGWGWDCVGRDG